MLHDGTYPAGDVIGSSEGSPEVEARRGRGKDTSLVLDILGGICWPGRIPNGLPVLIGVHGWVGEFQLKG